MRKTLLWTVTLCLAVLASYSNLLSAAAQGKKRITVPAGTRILIRTVDDRLLQTKNGLSFYRHPRN
jgi:hypothetical protein